MNVGRDDHASASHFIADQLRRQALPLGHVMHLFGDPPLPRVLHLAPDLVVHALCYPFLSHNAPILPDVNLVIRPGTAGESAITKRTRERAEETVRLSRSVGVESIPDFRRTSYG